MTSNSKTKGIQYLDDIKKLLKEGTINLDDLSNLVPGILHINKIEDLSFRYLSKPGQNIIGYTIEQLRENSLAIFKKHQSEFTLQITHPKVIDEFKDCNHDKVLLFYQDWKNGKEPPYFFLTITKIFDEENLLSVSFFPEKVENLTKGINQIFGINRIFLKYYKAYNSLTKREKQILDLLGKEKIRGEIAASLFITEATVKKHCENIYRKLGTHKRTELEKIAVSFFSWEN
ncbi:hypothetical protein GCM10023115_39240 [Pontixanthobacter gangjinensis]|uniref:Helix-turn-helix transcriptional regulator n=1 Tax=Christiangramia aestuarii TaxID=1028746 RepID=A0A7K1LSR5_9FLAO|nr:helix-turn-helix transcriptional regulator [Christiangramia aestuarii]MUP43855.1 helix-turn-helix transcriptional regulator [Christiangramia aestuarii]